MALLAAEPQAAAVALAMFAYALSHPISSSIARSMLEAATQGDREKRMRHDGTIQPPDRGGRSTMQRLERRRQHNARIRRESTAFAKIARKERGLERLRLCSEMLNEREGVATIDGLPNATPRQTAQSQMEAEPEASLLRPGVQPSAFSPAIASSFQPEPPWSARWRTFGAARSGSIARTTRHPISPIPMSSSWSAASCRRHHKHPGKAPKFSQNCHVDAQRRCPIGSVLTLP